VHTHNGEDEVFYVISGELTLTCGDDSFDAGPKDFVFLPQNVPHGYTIESDGPVHLRVVTVTRERDGRYFGRDIENTGEPVPEEEVLKHMQELGIR
jgi:quercetin dioxygenase-like cupin family protein